MEKIYKYPLNPIPGVLKIEMPELRHLLTVQTQNGNPVLWAVVDEESQLEEVTITTVFTGQEFDYNKNSDYLGTYQLSGLVFHVFAG